jgi:hypothetical protein
MKIELLGVKLGIKLDFLGWKTDAGGGKRNLLTKRVVGYTLQLESSNCQVKGRLPWYYIFKKIGIYPTSGVPYNWIQ